MANQLPPLPPSGWYPDPANPQQMRYWDGAKWLAPGQGTGLGVGSYGPTQSPSQRGTKLPWWQTWFVIVGGMLLCFPLGLISLWRRPVTTTAVKTVVTVAVALLVGIGFVLPDEADNASNNIAAKSPATVPAVTPTETPSVTPTPEPVLARVPALAGLDLAQARQELRSAGLSLGPVERQMSAKAAGTVLQQGLKTGAALEAGSAVALVVAMPFPRVPSLVGASKAATIRSLKSAGFRVETSVETRTSGADGVVLRQEPSAGTRAKPNSVVHVVISNIVHPVVKAPAPSNCTPGYTPCLAPASDYDCAGGSGNGPAYTGLVHVSGSDPYDLDSDGDGIACES